MSVTAPTFLPEPWANQGQSATIPDTTTETGRASWSQGFPTVTSLPLAAGGVPPNYLDFQGVLNALSQHIFFLQSGGVYPWSEALDYIPGCFVLGSDSNLYQAIQESGVSSTPQNPIDDTENTYWISVHIKPFLGATSSTPGEQGIVPAPQAGQQNLPLTGSGVFSSSIDADSTQCLPLNGSRQMTGSIIMPQGLITYYQTEEDIGIVLRADASGSWSNTSGILLTSTNASNSPGAFLLHAGNESTQSELLGTPSGSLTWNDHTLMTPPNWGAAVQQTIGPEYTASSAGYIYAAGSDFEAGGGETIVLSNLVINGVSYPISGSSGVNAASLSCILCPVSAGTTYQLVVSRTVPQNSLVWIPCL